MNINKVLEDRIQGFLKDHIDPFLQQGYSHQAVDKLLACIGAWTDLTPRLRWPYQSIAATEAVRIRVIAKDRLPEFFPDRQQLGRGEAELFSELRYSAGRWDVKGSNDDEGGRTLDP